MAEISPFRGIRYNSNLVEPGNVTSPPYDVITPEKLHYYLEKDPRNVVRLILGQDLPEDDETNNKHSRAARYMDQWLADGVLVKENEPAIYVYEQTYKGEDGCEHALRGMIALVKIHDFTEGVILPHEFTLARPKSHLGGLLDATNANLDSVYGIYPDQEQVVDNITASVVTRDADEESTDPDGVRHRIWVVTDPELIESMIRGIKDKPVVIADGHHRYETSLAYRDKKRQENGNSKKPQPYDYIMMTLVNMYSPELMVYPTHRKVRSADAEKLLGALGSKFKLVESSKESLVKDMETYGGKSVGMYLQGKAYVVVYDTEDLDIVVLHNDILEGILGIDRDRLRFGTDVSYTRDADEAMCAVDNKEVEAAFVLNPISLEAMLKFVSSGERMPQKSTYFYPKLLSGLVMRRID